MVIKPLKPRLEKFLAKHHLNKQWEKSKNLFKSDISHPSLNVELLEPKWRGIYSFRIDKQHRALFFVDPHNNQAEILEITKHYRKS